MVLTFYKSHKFSDAFSVRPALQESTRRRRVSVPLSRGIGHCAGFYERASKQIGARPTLTTHRTTVVPGCCTDTFEWSRCFILQIIKSYDLPQVYQVDHSNT